MKTKKHRKLPLLFEEVSLTSFSLGYSAYAPELSFNEGNSTFNSHFDSIDELAIGDRFSVETLPVGRSSSLGNRKFGKSGFVDEIQEECKTISFVLEIVSKSKGINFSWFYRFKII